MSHTTPLFATGPDDWRPTTDDHYTPAWIFEAMGLEFDLDVAAPPGGVPWIPAKRYYTISDDGLAQPWDGLVWCNPPFSAAAAWARRWVLHRDGVLLACASKATWPALVALNSEVLWLPGKPLDFLNPEGTSSAISYMVFMAGRGRGAVGVERLGPYGALLNPRRAA